MSEHTKGEWFAKRDGWSTVYIECRIGGGMLQEVAACGPTANGPEEQEANARLMAAAPDLLAAAERYLEFRHYDDCGMGCEFTGEHPETQLKRAISCAKGLTSF